MRCMFCPECGAEYRSGFTHCTDCDVNLVPDSSQAGGGKPRRRGPETRVDRKDRERRLALCKDFKAVGIPFKVEQSRHQYLQGLDEKYRISVPSEFFQKARRIVGPDKSSNRKGSG